MWHCYLVSYTTPTVLLGLFYSAFKKQNQKLPLVIPRSCFCDTGLLGGYQNTGLLCCLLCFSWLHVSGLFLVNPRNLGTDFFFPLSSTFLCELPSFSLNVTLKCVVKTLFCWHLWVTHNMETVGTVVSSPLLSAIKGKRLTLSPFSDWCACHTHPTSWSALCLYCGVSPRNPICVFRPVKITQL